MERLRIRGALILD